MDRPNPACRQRASLVLATLLLSATAAAQAGSRPRLRELGVEPGVLPTGPLNAITDVVGVRVGHCTLIQGEEVRTGVTAVLPHGGNLFRQKVPAAVHVGNAFGKAAGFLQVQELGEIETPIVLTNTLSVGTAVRAVAEWTLAQPGNEGVVSVNAVVGETNDGDLNDIRGFHVRVEHVLRAIDNAGDGPVEEGNVGAGTGTAAMGWKAGIGTSSRRLPRALGGFTVGALVQSNFGGILRIDGRPVGEHLGHFAFAEQLAEAAPTDSGRERSNQADEGSVMIVLATDAPLGSRNLERLARRAFLALGRVGSFMSHGSGDFVIAFSTAERWIAEDQQEAVSVIRLRDDRMSPLFLAAVEAVEEAIYNSLLKAETMTGHRGVTREALPLPALRQLFGRDQKAPGRNR